MTFPSGGEPWVYHFGYVPMDCMYQASWLSSTRKSNRFDLRQNPAALNEFKLVSSICAQDLILWWRLHTQIIHDDGVRSTIIVCSQLVYVSSQSRLLSCPPTRSASRMEPCLDLLLLAAKELRFIAMSTIVFGTLLTTSVIVWPLVKLLSLATHHTNVQR